MSKTKLITLVILCFLVLLSAAVFILKSELSPGWDFRNNLWAPAHLLVNHASPYRVDVLFEQSNAVWMPTAIGIWFWLGYLPLQQASNSWLLLNIIALILVVHLSINRLGEEILSIVSLIFLFALFPATISLISLGQITLIVCLAMLLVVNFDQSIPHVWRGLLLAFILSKPQISFLFIAAYFYHIYKEEGKSNVLTEFLYLAIWIGVSCLPLFLFYKTWAPDFVSNLFANQTWLQPTIYSKLAVHTHESTSIFFVDYLLIGLLVVIFLANQLPKRKALFWSMALTTVFSPYLWSWDFVLLFPIFADTYISQTSRARKVLLQTGYIICLIIFTVMKLEGKVSDELNWWIPPFLISLLLLNQIPSLRLSKLRMKGSFLR